MKPRVLFCDNHLIVVEKPTGLATQSDRKNERSLTTWVREWVKETFDKPGAAFAEPIHRLDKVTSGLVLFAKTGKALSRMVAEVRGGRWKKSYFALVESTDLMPQGVLEHHLIKESFRSRVDHRIGSLAQTHYRLIAAGEEMSLLLLSPLTGRYHQLRAQLAQMGWPIVGDGKYGARQIVRNHGIYLHHAHCSIEHPISGKRASFGVLAPDFWPQWALKAMRNAPDQAN